MVPDDHPQLPPSPAPEAAAHPPFAAAASPFTWTSTNEAVLEELWAGEGLSSGEIAKLLGISRNAVIGKAHRMGLPPHGPSQPKKVRPKTVQGLFGRTITLHEMFNLPAPPTISDVGIIPVSILELQSSHCRFPVDGAGADMLFCGAYTDKAPYCGKHQEIAYWRR